MTCNDLQDLTCEPREFGAEDINTMSPEEYKNYYLNENYETYCIEYFGDILSAIAKIDYAHVYITQKFFAMLFVQKGMLNTLMENVPEIIGVQQNFIYTLSELEIKKDISNEAAIYENNTSLDGEGVIVGIIGSGIDYLSPRFITEAGKSRILSIWDQTINTRSHNEIFPYGTEFHKDKITEAVKTKALGGDPFKIVAHKDEVGHGTALAGLIGGRNPVGEDRLKSIVPKCEFAIVKLEEVRDNILELAGVEKGTKNVYQLTNIVSAISYLSNLQLKLKRPMVVYLPLGTNFGSRDGGTILERYIDNLTERRDFCIVTNTGNQGSGRTHTSGIIKATGDIKDILIKIDKAQSSLCMAIYIRRPDVVSFSITSPRGDRINKIPIPSIEEQNKHLTYEENNVKIRYFALERINGAINLNIIIQNTFEGIWKISLLGEHIVGGLYDAWLLQSELLKGDTKFLNPNPNTTLLSPGAARNIVTTSYYNQIDNTIVQSSGKGLPRNGKIEPSLTIGGVNLLTVSLNNSLVLGTGPAMAGAILAGVVAIVYQWGLVQGNYLALYPPRLKNLLITGTEKDDKKLYPNDEWGFGKLSLNKLYEILIGTINDDRNYTTFLMEKSNSCLYINIPMEVYERLR